MPRNCALPLRHLRTMTSHYALIGMAHVAEGYPLYYDAVNEMGLGIAGLNFVGNASYADAVNKTARGFKQVAQFEFIPWLLGQCASVKEAKKRIERLCLVNTPFGDQYPPSELHWLLADKDECLVIESMKNGLHIYDNPVGVLTNNPPFPVQMFSLNNYPGVSSKRANHTFSDSLKLDSYSRGLGGIGIPGDLSSQSRFVKAAFTKINSVSARKESSSVSQFFHILGSVDQARGCCEVKEGEYEMTLYSSCWNATKGFYYYTTYDNHQITAVDMHAEDLEGAKLIRYPLISEGMVRWQNR